MVLIAVFIIPCRYLWSTAVALLYTTLVQLIKRVLTTHLAVDQTMCEVLTNVDAQVYISEAANLLHFKLLDFQWLMR